MIGSTLGNISGEEYNCLVRQPNCIAGHTICQR